MRNGLFQRLCTCEMIGVWSVLVATLVAVDVSAADDTQRIRYDGYTVHQAVSSSHDQFQKFISEASHIPLNFWHVPHADNDTLDVMVGPEALNDLQAVFDKLKMESKQVVDNVESLFEKERRSMHHIKRRATPSIHSYTVNYHSYSEIIDYLQAVSSSRAKSQNVHADVFSIGKTTQGKDQAMIKIYRNDGRAKPAILIDGGIHAREWIAPAVVINFIYQLAFSSDHHISTMLGDFDWYLMPLVNPDGYEYSRLRDRSWRKTMNVNAHSSCKGTDANRNFGYHWDPYSGGSTNPCEEVFAGDHNFSIPESTNLGNFMRQHGPSIKAYLTFHSYGQYFLYPYGYSSSAVAPDYAELASLARAMVQPMSSSYVIGSSGKDLYPAAGGSDDYAKGACGIKYSYTVELPPRDSVGGYTGFILSPSQIPIVAADTLTGLKAFAIELARRLH
ncbi:carboxypeptidase B-like isoform X2 [Haliotis rufescens]|uniref:carboxypeptidase B-like isoform X2 n=1 Tax=Haliotis rufescens TaxID=6454 RepID=UPI001EB059F6|nr:carboxypeptidase B-like isoform X2 [Haliotis rufescens]